MSFFWVVFLATISTGNVVAKCSQGNPETDIYNIFDLHSIVREIVITSLLKGLEKVSHNLHRKLVAKCFPVDPETRYNLLEKNGWK